MERSKGLNRLRSYNYAGPGAYFVTICTAGRIHLFGEVEDSRMVLSDFGRIVEEHWEHLPSHYPNVSLDSFVTMPNHIHGIIVLNGDAASPVGAGLRPATAQVENRGLSEILRSLKSFSAREINKMRGTPGAPVWQRNFYEHVIRNEREIDAVRKYIAGNPAKWGEDPENRTVVVQQRGGS